MHEIIKKMDVNFEIAWFVKVPNKSISRLIEVMTIS